MSESKGKLFRTLVKNHAPLQILGTINPFCAKLAEQCGAKAIYLSGAGVANASFGLPDLGITTLHDVLEDASRITQASQLPLLVDVDTAWGHVFNIARTVKAMEQANVAAIHIEDQVGAKRCGHRPNKAIVSKAEMGDRIKAAVDARSNADFVIMARTDAFANEGMEGALERIHYYLECGADMIFPEALTELEQYQHLSSNISAPFLANITEFGKTPLYTADELLKVGVSMVLYPLSAFRAMSKAAIDVYSTILNQGTQQSCLGQMQTRDELYDVLNYQHYEQKLDQLLGEEHGK